MCSGELVAKNVSPMKLGTKNSLPDTDKLVLIKKTALLTFKKFFCHYIFNAGFFFRFVTFVNKIKYFQDGGPRETSCKKAGRWRN